MTAENRNGVLPYLHRLYHRESPAAETDHVLLHRFAEQQEEAAFLGLLHRHGPMVLATCRRILHDSHTVEDAFQATFLMLVRKAEAAGRRGSVGGWVYRVAYHIALKAKAQSARRLAREQPLAEGSHAHRQAGCGTLRIRSHANGPTGR